MPKLLSVSLRVNGNSVITISQSEGGLIDITFVGHDIVDDAFITLSPESTEALGTLLQLMAHGI
jgi:hypothetical protein